METPGTGTAAKSATELVRNALSLLGLHAPLLAAAGATPKAAAPPPPGAASAPADQGWFMSGLHHLVELGEKIVKEVETEAMLGLMKALLGLLEQHLRLLMHQRANDPLNIFIKRAVLSIYLFQTVVHGVLYDGVLTKGFDQLDTLELSEWLRGNAEIVARAAGAPDPAAAADELVNWAPIVSGYDYVFGYVNGDVKQPGYGAGTALRSFLQLLFGYKGHLFYLMRGAMGDVVIAPLYIVLARRGVKFEFFSRVSALTPDAGGTLVDEIAVVHQARTVDGTPYRPLIDANVPGWPAETTLEAWPSAPLWDQLVDGAALKASGVNFEIGAEPELQPPPPVTSLRRGVDFDDVILGIPVGELRRITPLLAARSTPWAEMLGALKTTRTYALQLWFTRANDDLGSPAPGRTLTGDDQPLSTWADMSHVLTREYWRGVERPQSVAYFCGQMPGDSDAPGQPLSGAAQRDADAGAEREASAWLKRNAHAIWPRVSRPEDAFGLLPEVLFDPEDRAGGERWQSQYWRANIAPSELYVQSVPGSLFKRLAPHDSGFDNLFLAGDWTRNGLNAGAAEAAAMSGLQCANALQGAVDPSIGRDILL
jgi:uncharacterized protein with NAD-binding domain and iron-sulfur cluster